MTSVAMETQESSQPTRVRFFRAFAPFWITALLCSIIAAIDYHHRHAPLTILQAHITVDGDEPEEGFELLVGGKPARLGNPITLGSKQIVVSTAYSDPVTLSHFVWYGPNNLGTVDLHRQSIAFTLDVKPNPDEIELQSRFGKFTSRNGTFRNVPAARYEATLSYGSLKDAHQLQITKRVEPTISVIARVGAVALRSEPPEGSFKLENVQNRRSWSGQFPQTVAWLPTGEYQLAALRGKYRKEHRIFVSPNKTNNTVVQFIYGTAEILSEPSKATVFVDNTDRGQTPMTLTNVIPGKYQIRLEKAHHAPEIFELKVDEARISKVSRKLNNVRYAQSMEAAKRAIQLNNNVLALANLETALTEQPNDNDAMALVATVQPAALRDTALAFAEAGQFAAIPAILEELEQFDSKSESTEKLNAQIAQIKTRKERESADRLARQEQQRAEAEMRQRKQELEAAFESMQSDMTIPSSIPSATWKSTKSLQQVQAAFETISQTGKEGKASSLRNISDHLFTLRFGKGVPIFGRVYQTRIAVCNLATGHTEIRARALSLSLADLIVPADVETIRSRNHLEKLRIALSTELEGDLQ
jgi:hypothetical protein